MIHVSKQERFSKDGWAPAAYRLEEKVLWADETVRVGARTIGKNGGQYVVLQIQKGSFWDKSIYERGDIVAVLQGRDAIIEPYRTVCLIVSRPFIERFRAAMDEPTAYKRLLQIPEMQPCEQKHFAELVLGDKQSAAKSDANKLDRFGYGNRVRDLHEFYMKARPFMAKEQREAADDWAASVGNSKSVNKLEALLSISPAADRDRERITRESILSVLDSKFLGCDAMKEALSSAFAEKARRDKRRGAVILLYGLPGTGKTFFAEILAEALSLSYKRINLGTTTTTLSLFGADPKYQNAAPGVIVEAMKRKKTSEMLFLLDEVDKGVSTAAKHDQDEKILESLLPLLDRANPAVIDAFLDGVPIDCSNTVFVLTANRKDNLPPELLNRCEFVFEMPPMEDAVLRAVVRKKAAELAAEHELPDNWLSAAAAETLLSYRGDFGARDAVSFADMLSLLALRSPEALPLTAEAAAQELSRVIDVNDPAVRFHRNEEKYPAAQRKDIMEAFSRRMGGDNLSDIERRSLDLRIDHLTRLIREPPKPFDRETFYAYVKERLYGCAEVTDAIAADLYAADVHGIKPGRKLFLGPPGVGKSVFAEAVGAATGRKYVRIQMNGISQPEDIRGVSPYFTAATAGTFFKGLVDGGSTTAIVYFDEIDKIPHQVAAALLDVLDDSGRFYNMFTESWIDISDALVCASANDISNVDPALLSRFEIVEMDGYTALEKREIAREHLLPEIIHNAEVAIEPEAFDAVLARYETEAGVRSVKHALKSVVQRCLLKQNGDPAGVCIRREDVEDILGPAPYRYIAGSEPGCANGLATLSGRQGLVMPVRVTLLSSGKRRITGLPEETVRDSIAVAETWVEKLGYSLEGGVHIHFAPAGVKKDGPSAGVAVAVALLSAVTGLPVTDAAFTGEFDGECVLPVGGLKLKLQAAKSAGIHTVYLPAACRSEIDETLFEGVELRYVSAIDEIVKERFPQLSRSAAR